MSNISSPKFFKPKKQPCVSSMFLTTRPVFFGIVLWHCSTALFYGIVLGHCSVALVGIRSHCATFCLIASRPVALYVLFVPVLQLFVLFIPTNVFAALFSSPKRWFFTESNYLRNYNGILRMESLYGRKDWTAQDWCNIYYAGDSYYRGTCVCVLARNSRWRIHSRYSLRLTWYYEMLSW